MLFLSADRTDLVRLFCLVCATLLVGSEVTAQNPPNRPAQKPGTPKTQQEIEIPPPEIVSLTTKDSVNLKCTFFAAPQDETAGSGKQALAFILVHDWGGSRRDLLPFAAYLQSLGCAVIVPDLRGHGESDTVVGSTQKIDHEKFRRTELNSVVLDLERCKKYLVQKNDLGELNIDLLNIVAVGKTSIFAVEWAIADWRWPDINGVKQGRDVKSVTLVAPSKKLKNLSLTPFLKHELFSGRSGFNLPTLVVWAKNGENANDSEAAYELMYKGRPDPEEIEDLRERAEKTTLIKAEIPASRADGTELMAPDSVKGLWKYIAEFVSVKVAAKKDQSVWQSRDRE